MKQPEGKDILLVWDLYFFRFKDWESKWYELTDLIREHLEKKGFTVTYTDDDVVVNGLSGKYIDSYKKKDETENK